MWYEIGHIGEQGAVRSLFQRQQQRVALSYHALGYRALGYRALGNRALDVCRLDLLEVQPDAVALVPGIQIPDILRRQLRVPPFLHEWPASR